MLKLLCLLFVVLYNNATPRENRIRSGLASRRIVQRYLNAVNVSDTEASMTEGEDSEEGDKAVVRFDYKPKFKKEGADDFFTAPDAGALDLEKHQKFQAERARLNHSLTPAQRQEREILRRKRRAARVTHRANQNERVKRILAEESARLALSPEVLTARLAALGIEEDDLSTRDPVPVVSDLPLSYASLTVEDYFSTIDPIAQAILQKSSHTKFFHSLDLLLSVVKLRQVPVLLVQDIHSKDYVVNNDPYFLVSDEADETSLVLSTNSLPMDQWVETYISKYVQNDGVDVDTTDFAGTVVFSTPDTYKMSVGGYDNENDMQDVKIQCNDMYGTRILKALADFHQLDLIVEKDDLSTGDKAKPTAIPTFKIQPRSVVHLGETIFVPHPFSLKSYLQDLAAKKLQEVEIRSVE